MCARMQMRVCVREREREREREKERERKRERESVLQSILQAERAFKSINRYYTENHAQVQSAISSASAKFVSFTYYRDLKSYFYPMDVSDLS